MDYRRPTLLDDNDIFDMSRPFLVSERLDALAYHMSFSPALSEKCVDPQSCLANKFTTEYVEHDDQCTPKPLYGPPPDFIHELLRVTIDLRQDSPLRLAMIQRDSCSYFFFRSYLTAKTMPYSPIAGHSKSDYPHIVGGSLHTLIPLASVLLLQLWIHDGASDDTQAFHMACDTLMHLGWSTSTCDSPNHAAFGHAKDAAPLVFTMVERMPHPFVDGHQDSFKHFPFASPSQDCPPFDDVPDNFIDEGSMCRCNVDTRRIIAQVHLTFLLF